MGLDIYAKNQDGKTTRGARGKGELSRSARDAVVESALADCFPSLGELERRGIANVIGLWSDGKLTIKGLAAATIKGELTNALNKENPGLGKLVEVVDFLYKLYQAR